MKKILVISPSNKGTIASCTANIINTLTKCQDVEVYPLVLYNEKDGLSIYNNCRFIIDSATGSQERTGFLKKLRKFKSIKEEIKPDITISTLVSVNTLSVLSGGHDKKIGIFHAPLAQTKNVSMLNFILCTLSYKFLFRKLDYLYAVSETTKKDVEANTGQKVQLVYNIHDFKMIEQKAQAPLSAEESSIFGKPTVLYVGHLYDTKGVRRLLQAFSKVSSDANLVLVGGSVNGTIPQTYIDLANELCIGQRTYFLGHQSNPYKYMKNCSVFCLPSYSEGLPGVLIEALSLNKKVITTNSSIGDWEIMQCFDDYNSDVTLPFENELGIITSNEDKGNKCINQLTDAIEKFLLTDSRLIPFDKTRFEGKSLAKYYLLENEK